MKTIASLILLLFLSLVAVAQNTTEGTYVIDYKTDDKTTAKMEVKVAGDWVYFKNLAGGINKYSHFTLNTKTRTFYTFSKPEKKVLIQYNIDKLLSFYEKKGIKSGYKINSSLTFKPTEQVKTVGDTKQTKYESEGTAVKATYWLSPSNYNFNALIPVLRLLGIWNNTQAKQGIIWLAEEKDSTSPPTSITVTFNNQEVSKELFDLPKDYLVKDFEKLMQEQKGKADLDYIIRNFAGF